MHCQDAPELEASPRLCQKADDGSIANDAAVAIVTRFKQGLGAKG